MPSLTLPRQLQALVQDLQQGLKQLYGDRFNSLILFGSHARNQATPDSDIDLLIVLQGPISPGDEILRMGTLKTDLNLKYDELISVVPISETDYRDRNTPLLINIRKEGIVL